MKDYLPLFAVVSFVLFVVFLFLHLRNLLKNRRRRAAGIPNPIGDGDITTKTPAMPATQFSLGRQPHSDKLPRRPPPSLGKTLLAIVVCIALGVAIVCGYIAMGSHDKAAATDSCSACRPDEKTIGVDAVLDDGKIRWNWSGPCVGSETCGKCRVKIKSCTTDNDTAFALKCACVNQ
jgi:hypothetical protein